MSTAPDRDGDRTVEPPESWHGANQFGMNEDEAEQGESLDDKLDADLSDVFTNEEEYDAENNQEGTGQEE